MNKKFSHLSVTAIAFISRLLAMIKSLINFNEFERIMKVKSAKGFSLIELLIVIAILSILCTQASPYFTKYMANVNLKEAARKISGDIQLCKRMAVAENTHFRMLINAAANEYTIQRKTSPSTWANVFSTIKVCGNDANIKIIGDTTYADDQIVFQPRGTTNAGTLKIQHEKILSQASIITSLMGRVRIQYDLK